MEDFKDLGRLPDIHRHPIKTSLSTAQVDSETFAEVLEKVYEDAEGLIEVDIQEIENIPFFTLTEFSKALNKMRKRRGADMSNVVVELVKSGTVLLHEKLLEMYNSILSTGAIPQNWLVTIFHMLPKSGDLQNPSNWRPIAILPILYKVFARMLHNRLSSILENEQSDDQFGFCPNRRIEDVFAVLESVISKTIEWNVPLWMVSIDLRKAFDRISHRALFQSLREQNVPESYIQLLGLLYQNQTGCVNGSKAFPILRGVKQGDIISPMLFNAGIEKALRE